MWYKPCDSEVEAKYSDKNNFKWSVWCRPAIAQLVIYTKCLTLVVAIQDGNWYVAMATDLQNMVHSNISNVRGLAYCTCGSETLHLLSSVPCLHLSSPSLPHCLEPMAVLCWVKPSPWQTHPQSSLPTPTLTHPFPASNQNTLREHVYSLKEERWR